MPGTDKEDSRSTPQFRDKSCVAIGRIEASIQKANKFIHSI